MLNDHAARVALVTYDARPEPTDDDQLLADALSARGAMVHALSWSDASARWAAYDAVVVRSCWDYFLRADEFHAWLDRLERGGARVMNDVRTLRWNADKTYLGELAERDVPIVPTRWLTRANAVSLGELRRLTGWAELVVKPTVSGGAHRTWRAPPDAEPLDEARLAAMIEEGAVMVQPMLAEIARDGEWSLLFFAGRYSHAVLKRPRAGDFRVQREHGGSLEPAEPSPAMVAAAKRVLDAIPAGGEPPLYARVDGCVVDGELLLMELEVLEPELFLRCAPEAPARLAEALLARIA
jgi:glutathione synthase/RimK-type ligase-like ATP-grasp enzyme